MGELWVNYAELADAIGEDGAEKLCRAVGGGCPRTFRARSRKALRSAGSSAWNG